MSCGRRDRQTIIQKRNCHILPVDKRQCGFYCTPKSDPGLKWERPCVVENPECPARREDSHCQGLMADWRNMNGSLPRVLEELATVVGHLKATSIIFALGKHSASFVKSVIIL
ncbi:hypothetical protein J6590_049978 [Homalodisca vitripennis]|nr:hypothetical protein J6590_049978 [Homalodisca vitripennis]